MIAHLLQCKRVKKITHQRVAVRCAGRGAHKMDEHHVRRRVTGHHDLRMDGIGDLLFRAQGASVLDVGCNRGMAGYEFACNGAKLVHGCDSYQKGIETAREIFADNRAVESHFEVLDLTIPNVIQLTFGDQRYDIVLLLAIYHKLLRVMDPTPLMLDLAKRCNRYIGWRGYKTEIEQLTSVFVHEGFTLIQTSEISETICPAAIWRR
jgi:2-polyprenyl-3-methyl-5-hydroxy-6-metoxy-1,4-benzoquinol methylase